MVWWEICHCTHPFERKKTSNLYRYKFHIYIYLFIYSIHIIYIYIYTYMLWKYYILQKTYQFSNKKHIHRWWNFPQAWHLYLDGFGAASQFSDPRSPPTLIQQPQWFSPSWGLGTFDTGSRILPDTFWFNIKIYCDKYIILKVVSKNTYSLKTVLSNLFIRTPFCGWRSWKRVPTVFPIS